MSYLRAAVPAISVGGAMLLDCAIVLLGLTAVSIGLRTAFDLLA